MPKTKPPEWNYAARKGAHLRVKSRLSDSGSGVPTLEFVSLCFRSDLLFPLKQDKPSAIRLISVKNGCLKMGVAGLRLVIYVV